MQSQEKYEFHVSTHETFIKREWL